jgi:hypothetical protein
MKTLAPAVLQASDWRPALPTPSITQTVSLGAVAEAKLAAYAAYAALAAARHLRDI